VKKTKFQVSRAMQLEFPSFAKINLDLRIIGKRTDGFHEIETIFQTVSIRDFLSFEYTMGEIQLIVKGLDVPDDQSNLVFQAANLLVDRKRTSRGIRITLQKQIPLGAGLGGGSSNAAVTLLTLNKMWKCDCESAELKEMAARLGSDVAFFLEGGTAYGSGRGENIQPIEDIDKTDVLVVNPCFSIPTFKIYQALNLSSGAMLTTSDTNTKIRRFQKDWAQNKWSVLKNDLEATAFSRYPVLDEMKKALRNAGSEFVMLSGSGSSLFSIGQRDEVLGQIKNAEIFEQAQLYSCHTVSKREYRQGLWET